MTAELQPIPFDAIPEKGKLKIGSEVIKEIIYIDRIFTDGDPKYRTFDKCRVCGHGTLTYSRGPRYHFSNGSLLWINDIWAYRCSNNDCDAPLLFIPKVHEELTQKILITKPRPVSYNSSIYFFKP